MLIRELFIIVQVKVHCKEVNVEARTASSSAPGLGKERESFVLAVNLNKSFMPRLDQNRTEQNRQKGRKEKR